MKRLHVLFITFLLGLAMVFPVAIPVFATDVYPDITSLSPVSNTVFVSVSKENYPTGSFNINGKQIGYGDYYVLRVISDTGFAYPPTVSKNGTFYSVVPNVVTAGHSPQFKRYYYDVDSCQGQWQLELTSAFTYSDTLWDTSINNPLLIFCSQDVSDGSSVVYDSPWAYSSTSGINTNPVPPSVLSLNTDLTNKTFSNSVLNYSSPYPLVEVHVKDLDHISIAYGEQNVGIIDTHDTLEGWEGDYAVIFSNTSGLTANAVNQYDIIPFGADGVTEVNTENCHRITVQVKLGNTNSGGIGVNPSTGELNSDSYPVYPAGGTFFDIVEYYLQVLMFYIAKPFQWIGDTLSEIGNWLDSSMVWISQVSAFFGAIFGFLPAPIVGAFQVTVLVTFIFTILRVMRG